MTDNSVEVISPPAYQAPTDAQATSTVAKVLITVLILVVLCCCCVCVLVFLTLWGGLGWLWNNGDQLIYGVQLLSLV